MPFIRKIRFYFHLLSALAKRYYRIIISGIFFGGLIALIITYSYSHLAKLIVSTQKIGLIGQYTLSNLPTEVLRKLSYGLTGLNDKNEVIPGIADKWLIDNEGKRFEFLIIPEKYSWNNDKPFSTNDLNYNFKNVTIETTDNSIIFTLEDAFAPLPSILTEPIFQNGLIGLGDYRLSKYVVKGNTVKSLSLTSLKPEDKSNILYRFYPTITDLKLAFNLGEIDYLDGITSTEGISENKNVTFEPYLDINSFTALYFNTEKPEFAEKTFRQTLAYAINKPTNNQRSLSSYNPDSWAYNGSVKPYNYDVNRALELTSKENIEKNREVIISVLPQDIEIAEQVIKDFQTIGLKSKYEVINFLPDDYDMLLLTREIPPDPDQYSYWHSTQPGNFSNLINPRLDKLLEDGRKTVDQNTRKNIYLDFQRYLLEECPAVFLSHPTLYRVTRN